MLFQKLKGLSFVLFLTFVFPALTQVVHAKDRYPVIFVHGLIATHRLYQRVVPLEEVFAENGYQVLIAERPSGLTIEERAEVLRSEINRLVPEGKFHVIGHSAGGIDTRYALYKYKELGERCLSLTTIGTPHWGSPIADEILRSVDDDQFDLKGALFGFIFKTTEDGRRIAEEMSTPFMQEFNKEVVNDPRVRYFSYAFYIEQPFWKYTRPTSWQRHVELLKLGFKINDGVVPAASAQWGEFMGLYPGDHLSEMSQIKYDNKEVYRDNIKMMLENLDNNF